MDNRDPSYFGNASKDHFGRGWVVGHFVPDARDLRATDDVEIKWSVHAAGDRRAAWTDDEHRTTISFLVSGHFSIHLPTGVCTMQASGDYVVWGPGVNHSWEAIEDSVVVTIRWPGAERV